MRSRARHPSAHPVARGVLAVLVLVLAAVYLRDPEGVGGLVYVVTVAAALVSMIIGPLVHHPVNALPWRLGATAGALFLVSLVVRLDLVPLPAAIGNADSWAFAGYGATALFLGLLLRTTRGTSDPIMWLDTALVTTGAALVGWVLNIAPQLASPSGTLGATVVATTYPVMDAVLMALTVQLAFRRGTRVPAMRAALVGIGSLLAGDLAYTFIWLAQPGATNATVNLLYVVAYVAIGVMACHRSMRELSDAPAWHTPVMTRGRQAALLVAMLVPAALPVLRPASGALDAWVRAGAMAVLLGLVYLRLLRTILAVTAAEEVARYRATHDALTDLPNRTALMDELDAHLAVTAAAPGEGWVNVFFVDCDHFKHVNDTWGHPVGDAVLVQVAARLREVVRTEDFLARVGGDEFFLRVDTRSAEDAAAIAGRVLEAFAEPLLVVDGHYTRLTPSVGVAQVPYGTSTTGKDLVRDADLALYQAKGAGRATFSLFDASMHQQVSRRLLLADALRGALARDEFDVVFQPIHTGPAYERLCGWEVLVRWNSPEHGAVPPVDFIPIAEDTGLIVEIGAFVLGRACRQLATWQEQAGRRDLHVSVNVSGVQLLRDDVPLLVARTLAETGLEPSCLWLEITESVVVERTDEALATLNALAELGVTLCMDDFGTGYSSLGFIKDFPLHVIKVDRSFVRDLVEDPRDRALTKAIIEVATTLGMSGVVAEGVETLEQAVALEELGCSMVQGWYFGRPVPAGQVVVPPRVRAGAA